MKRFYVLIALISLTFAAGAGAMEGMDHGSTQKGEAFVHAAMVDGIHAEFQVMDLADMNITDPEGKTHHIMVSFLKNNEKITKAAGKIKLITPSGQEQISDLKDFGSGVFAANFKIDENGKYGVICLFKDEAGPHTVKFWYEHHKM
ncbi:MAG: hypothetical protein VR65_08615 [Desulfobulbaceae bacterium BRH_c16a]|nr:MAG: hypothetical protein VR65_08615 [Desulfobulbaceae bacterium BRH_c16a]